MKRKQPDSGSEDERQPVSTPKRQKTTAANGAGVENGNGNARNGSPEAVTTPSRQAKTTPRKPNTTTPAPLKESGLKTPSQRAKAKALFTTPTKPTAVSTPTRARNADRSAKKKSAQLLFEQDEDDVWDGADRLAEEILEDDDDYGDKTANGAETEIKQSVEEAPETTAEKPPPETPKTSCRSAEGCKE